MKESKSWSLRHKTWTVLIGVTFIVLITKVLNYNKPYQFFADIPLLSLVMALLIKFRKSIAKKIKKIPLPNFILYLIVWLPFSIFEENINCLPTGCKVIPSTIPMLFIFGLVLGILVIKFKPKRIGWPLSLFSIFGLLWEIFLGGLRGGILGPIGIFFSIWTMIGYAFIAIIPLTILIEER